MLPRMMPETRTGEWSDPERGPCRTPSEGHVVLRAGDMSSSERGTCRLPSEGHVVLRAGDMSSSERGTCRPPNGGHVVLRTGDMSDSERGTCRTFQCLFNRRRRQVPQGRHFINRWLKPNVLKLRLKAVQSIVQGNALRDGIHSGYNRLSQKSQMSGECHCGTESSSTFPQSHDNQIAFFRRFRVKRGMTGF
jgi:hypothetical protein